MLRIAPAPTARASLIRSRTGSVTTTTRPLLAPPSFGGGGITRPATTRTVTTGVPYNFVQGVRYSAGAAPSFLEAPLLPVVLSRMGFSDVAVYERGEAPAHLTVGRQNDTSWTHVATGLRTDPSGPMAVDRVQWINELIPPGGSPAPGSGEVIPPAGDIPIPTPWSPAEPQPGGGGGPGGSGEEPSGVSPVVIGLIAVAALGALYVATR